MPATPDSLLYHYTDAHALIGILKDNFWLSNIQSLNDSQEYAHGSAFLDAYINELQDDPTILGLPELMSESGDARDAFFSVLNGSSTLITPDKLGVALQNTSFLGSFSRLSDNLTQWRTYCPPEGGYAIGFSKRALSTFANANHDMQLLDCVYSKEDKEKVFCKQVLDWYKTYHPRLRKAETTHKSITQVFIEIALRYKHPAFAAESEVRLVSTGITNPLETHSLDFGVSGQYVKPRYVVKGLAKAIREVWIGPTRDMPRAASGLRMLLSCYPLEDNWKHKIEARKSSIPFRHG